MLANVIKYLPLVLVLVLQDHILAESNYDQPYLGVWPKTYSRFSAEHLRTQAEQGLAGKVKKADVILVGAAHSLREIKVSDSVERVQFYEADVKVMQVIKGESNSRQVHLKFVPSATSIEDGAEHVFLLKTPEGKPPTVAKSRLDGEQRRSLLEPEQRVQLARRNLNSLDALGPTMVLTRIRGLDWIALRPRCYWLRRRDTGCG